MALFLSRGSRQLKFVLVALVLLLSSAAPAQTVQYKPLPPEIIQARLQKYAGNDQQREATLKQMFAEAGCQQLAEQPVKGSKLPNVICTLPGSTDRTIIVGAHFDHVPLGDGVVDNWSGASLLPSLYEAVKGESRKHTFIFYLYRLHGRGEGRGRLAILRAAHDKGKRRHNRRDGQHGHARSGAGGDLGESFGPEVARRAPVRGQAIESAGNRCERGAGRQHGLRTVCRAQDSEHYHPFTDPGDVERAHLAHLERQDFRGPVGRLLPDLPATVRVYRLAGRSAATASEGEVGKIQPPTTAA